MKITPNQTKTRQRALKVIALLKSMVRDIREQLELDYDKEADFNADDLSLCMEEDLFRLLGHWAHKTERKYYPPDFREGKPVTLIEGSEVSILYVERTLEEPPRYK